MPRWEHWNYTAQAIHHISRNNLIMNGKPSDNVAIKLNKLLDGDVIYCDSIEWDEY